MTFVVIYCYFFQTFLVIITIMCYFFLFCCFLLLLFFLLERDFYGYCYYPRASKGCFLEFFLQ